MATFQSLSTNISHIDQYGTHRILCNSKSKDTLFYLRNLMYIQQSEFSNNRLKKDMMDFSHYKPHSGPRTGSAQF